MPELEELYRDIKDKLYCYIFKLSGNKHIAEEIVQETFYRALEHLLVSNHSLSNAWFYTVAKHLYFDYIKRQSKLDYDEKLDTQVDGSHNNLDHTIFRNFERTLVRKILAQLRDSYREILVLREFKELYEKEQ